MCGNEYTPAESSRVESHGCCRVKSLHSACLIFDNRTPVIGLPAAILSQEINVEHPILLFTDQQAP